MAVKIKFGPSNSIEKDASAFATVGAAVKDEGVSSLLGYDPANVDVRLNGEVITDMDTTIDNEDVITVAQKAQTKGC